MTRSLQNPSAELVSWIRSSTYRFVVKTRIITSPLAFGFGSAASTSVILDWEAGRLEMHIPCSGITDTWTCIWVRDSGFLANWEAVLRLAETAALVHFSTKKRRTCVRVSATSAFGGPEKAG